MESRIDAYTHAVASYLAKPRHAGFMPSESTDYFYLEGRKYTVNECIFTSTISMRAVTRLSITCDEPVIDTISVMYELKPNVLDDNTRVEACMKLADKFVRNMLPRVDYRFKIMIHNEEVEEALAVL